MPQLDKRANALRSTYTAKRYFQTNARFDCHYQFDHTTSETLTEKDRNHTVARTNGLRQYWSNSMMQLSRFLACAMILALASGCFRPDRRTITVAVPQMSSPACYAIIVESLKGIEGIESAQPDYDARSLSVTFNGLRLAIRNVEYAIAATGFDANDLTGAPEAKARLPEGCR